MRRGVAADTLAGRHQHRVEKCYGRTLAVSAADSNHGRRDARRAHAPPHLADTRKTEVDAERVHALLVVEPFVESAWAGIHAGRMVTAARTISNSRPSGVRESACAFANSSGLWRDGGMSDRLAKHLDAALAILPEGGLVVALSGGMDSSVLLHALAASMHARARDLRALHVDHGLHPDSAHWAEHCRAFAARLDIPIETVRVAIDHDSGTGLEDAARRARMAAFAQNLRPGEVLALAQHRDDQAETVLLKLLRGAGPEGLGGMRVLREFGMGQLWRPLLDLTRAHLHEYAQARGLRWIEDPSNAHTQLRRNFLRQAILPRLAH